MTYLYCIAIRTQLSADSRKFADRLLLDFDYRSVIGSLAAYSNGDHFVHCYSSQNKLYIRAKLMQVALLPTDKRNLR
jgi:hypothetical protein